MFTLNCFFLISAVNTLPKTNIASENKISQKKIISYSNHLFWGASCYVSFRECNTSRTFWGSYVGFAFGKS